MKINKASLSILIVLILSLLIRIVKLNNLSLFGDEIDVGYQAFSLLNSAKDYKGNLLPPYIQSLSESRAPLLIYFTVPAIKIFGLTETGVRIVPVIFGLISIYLLYKVVLLLSKSNTLALFSSISLSLSPWHFHYSRTAFEVTLLLSLILAGIYFIFKYLNDDKNKFLYLSILFFCLSFYTYNTANIFVPLIVLIIFFTNFSQFKSKIKPKSFFISLLIFVIMTSPILYQIFFGNAANRFGLISIFHNQEIIDQIINKRTSFSASSPNIEAIFHNKPIALTQTFVKNYLTAFSLPFLFIFGDQNNLRHSIPGFGMIFISFLPFLIYGLFSQKPKETLNKLMLSWLLISPIAASLTYNGGNHATRLFLMISPLSYYIGLGMVNLFSSKKVFIKIVSLTLCFTLFIEISLYTHDYFSHYPKDSFEVWNYGYQEMFKSIPANSNRIFISNARYNSLLPYVFYQKYQLKNNQILNDQEINISDNMSGFQIDSKTYFISNWQSQNNTIQKINQFAQSGDTFVLFQLKDIPGDMDLSKEPILGFNTIRTVYQPNHTILGQVIQKQ